MPRVSINTASVYKFGYKYGVHRLSTVIYSPHVLYLIVGSCNGRMKGVSKVKFKLATMMSLLCLCASLAPAQEFRSTISGHVTDASGSAVPNAKVQAVNVDNNETTTANTDNSGAYTVPFLRPGNYRLTATAAGFKQF